jgi:hypothetical protein
MALRQKPRRREARYPASDDSDLQHLALSILDALQNPLRI